MINNIQVLRGIAAMLVVAYHIVNKEALYGDSSNLIMGWFHIGNAGVDIFFVISGFIMMYVTRNHTTGPNINYIKTFFLKRIIRIYPIYWMFTLIGLCAYLIFPDIVNQNSQHGTSIWGSFTLIPTKGWFLVQPGWSLSYEIYFYLLFGIGLYFAHRLLVPVLATYFVASVLVRPYAATEHPVVNLITNSLLLEFLAGVIIGYLYLNKEKWFNQRIGGLSLLLSISLFASLLLFEFSDAPRHISYGLPSVLLVISALALENKIKTPRSLLVVGNSSYSLYLSHIFVLPFVGITWKTLELHVVFHNTILVLVMFMTAVLFGIACFYFVERKMISVLQNRLLNMRLPSKPQ